MRRGIACYNDGQPCLLWPGDAGTLAELAAALPEGTDYMLIDEDQADAWLEDHQPPESRAALRRAEIQARLDALDLRCIRPMRAILEGCGNDDDRRVLAEAEAEAALLRQTV